MSKFVGFGSGRDGLIPSSGTLNAYAVLNASNAGQQIVNTSLPVSIGDIVMLVNMYGGTPGLFEFVVVIAVGTNQFTAGSNLDNNYSGTAQAIKVFQASGGTVSAQLTPQAWNGATGGFGVIYGGGKVTIDATLLATGYGYRGGAASGNCNCPSNPTYSGEGTGGLQVFGSLSPGGNAGGGSNGNGMDGAPGGGGGGYGTAGSQGGNEQNGTGGSGGVAVGSDDMSAGIFLGGGGGGGRGEKNGPGNGGNGGNGGGGWIIFAREIVVTANGAIACHGNGGAGASGSGSEGGGGGGAGAGGLIWLKAQFITIADGTRIGALGGAGGSHSGTGPSGNGGNGGNGRIRFETCKLTIQSGAIPQSYSVVQGGFDFCGSLASMLE